MGVVKPVFFSLLLDSLATDEAQESIAYKYVQNNLIIFHFFPQIRFF